MFNYDNEKFTWKRTDGRFVSIGVSDADFSGILSFNSSTFTGANSHSNTGKTICSDVKCKCIKPQRWISGRALVSWERRPELNAPFRKISNSAQCGRFALIL